MRLFAEGSPYSVQSANRQPAATLPTRQVSPVDVEYKLRLLKVATQDKAPAAFASSPIRASKPYSYVPIKEQSQMSKAELIYDGISLFAKSLWPVELARLSISSTAKDHVYNRYLNAAQRAMVKKGYQLFINSTIAGDLNEFGREHSKKRMTGKEIKKLAQAFDRQFTFMGDLGESGIFTFLVSNEWDVKSDKQYEAKKATLYTTTPVGGMKGGGWDPVRKIPTGAYWGITQFGTATYNTVLAHAKGYGVDLPVSRSDMTFGQMLVAAYVLAITRQPTLVALGIEVNPATVYINHNQGNGVWTKKGAKQIKASAWDGQSTQVQTLLRSYGFQRA
ncbi:hypothetical protein [Cystovirus CAP4]|uniref:Uncharacterized protein n=1 Tax=Acinetobacter phage CAP7 TaxID=2822590 RepID=A0A9E6XCF2_9VIRU|nr:hypothetical protein [Cystovirus CAP4]UBF42582.1 hypothetical protein [Cystovirus CAP7]UBF42592.1 hypothetical protein [Cystovirus CAP6]UBF42602.1 hypothetical protein [Cystovirus CAP5]